MIYNVTINDKVYEVEPLYEAEIDAHTGEILRFTASYIM